MSKIIEYTNGFHTELTYYEKYIKLGEEDKQPFLKFLSVSLITFITADITLIIGFKTLFALILIISLLLFIISIYIYLRFYKKPHHGISFYTY